MYYKLAPIIHVLSRLGFVFSLLLLAPTFVSYLYQDAAFWVFADTAAATICASGIIWLITRSHQRELRTRDGFTLVFLLWVGFAVVASLPFYWYLPGISYTDAFFEAISGLTTTGATVFTNLDSFPPSLNFWRHLLNWVGGMGIIVLAVAILPMIGVGGTQLFKAEIPGIHKDSKLAPRISQTAKNLWLIYVFFTLITCLALRLAGMSWLDAVCHAMSCIGLGGFSTHDQNIAYFDSVPIEMILSVGSIIACALYLWHKDFYPDWSHALRFVGFNFISIGLANGYANTDFAAWPLPVSLWMFFLANILSNAGSAGGGLKTIRAIVLFKFSLREMMLLLHPNAVHTVKINGMHIAERTAMTVLVFTAVYFLTIIFATFALMATGLDFVTALTAATACITNAGPGLGSVGPAGSYAELAAVQKWLCAAVMLLGRLEIFTVFMLFTPAYWRK